MRKNFLLCLIIIILGSCKQPTAKEYFVRPCEFVCSYEFNDTSKWVITCRVWGLLKYYHPNVAAGKSDWDHVLLDQSDDILYSSTPEMINTELKKMLHEAGEYKYEKRNTLDDSLNMNVDLCWIDHSFLDDTLRSELKKIASLSVKYPSYYGIDFASTGPCRPQNEKVYKSDVISSFKYRLLALFRYWNVIYYYFPHKYLMDQSWDETLSESIFPFIEANDNQSYQIEFMKLAALLNDGHGYTYFNADQHSSKIWDVIEKVQEKTVIKIDGGGLRKGDIICSIGKRDVNTIRDSLSVLTPASTQGNKESRINDCMAEMMFSRKMNVTVLRNDKKITIQTFPITLEEDTCLYKNISEDIGYINLSLLTTDTIDLTLQSFSNKKGIIFDLRKIGPYYYDNILFEKSLWGKEISLSLSTVFGDPEHPGAFYLIKNPPAKTISDTVGQNGFKGKLVFLVNEFTQSAGETRAWIARDNFHATLIGRPTSGACGKIVGMSPPGLNTSFSGFALLSPDGTELQRKGIVPDIIVYPTMESIKTGKDEILDTAIKYLNIN